MIDTEISGLAAVQFTARQAALDFGWTEFLGVRAILSATSIVRCRAPAARAQFARPATD